MANQAKRFKATLTSGTQNLGWTVVRLPFDPHAVWSSMVRLRVRGTVLCPRKEVAFRTSLFPVPGESGHYFLLVNNRVQREAHLSLGSVAEFFLEPDLDPRPAELPDELDGLLDEEPDLRDYYNSLSESMRREIGKWVLQPKSEASRGKRAEQMAERLLGALEGERQLPPIVALAFKARPRAKLGWARMTQLQQRQQLLGVFYYQGVEARQRRVDKLCDEAEKRAD